MASRFSVDLEHLEHIVSRLSGLAAFIEDHLSDIEQRVASLQGTGWEGLAARAYDDAHREWISGARELVEGVKDMSDAAKEAHAAYTRALELNWRMLQSGNR
ncbi:WXG100 family type VII secretion target [Nocardia nova]|uniref:ESAT-6-like protein n=1 Tax=Nocardia nova TaxID=37330 RepID=A0A2S6AVE6_9NOCA|nr:WXG100 family type VII secretion target [Nocardia nova]PPJ22490.1 WXG100 family type VII secretion target [Nocardia nova]PPJ39163.1 WXG100 family type VII secretion target [Nocardia nova]